ncbi:hypothetical protein ff3pr_00309 [Weissella cibaria]|uniref:hypothetical protein n=1 Tax=Weissella cibaria TaxID=137591 RepID=UPI0005BD3CCF|nr:hypothetical protein [Weissella cibaria]KIU24329.1 hypothetical protein ff3pr_00309 [Weissella cibaria]
MMFKKTLASAVLGAAVLVAPVAAFAANETAASTTDNVTSATTTGSVKFEAGHLSLYNVNDAVDFGSANAATVFTNGYEATGHDESVNVDDYLADEGKWTLKVSSSDWTGDSAKTVAALNANAKLYLGTDDAKKEITPAGTVVATGTADNNGKAIDLGKYGLNIASGTNVTAGTYTNTLTWSLSNVAGATTN